MNLLLQSLASEEWAYVVKALLHTLWIGGLAAGGLCFALRGKTDPVARYRWCVGALFAVVLGGIVAWAVLQQRPTVGHPSSAVTPTVVAAPASGAAASPGDGFSVRDSRADGPGAAVAVDSLAGFGLAGRDGDDVGAGRLTGGRGGEVAQEEQSAGERGGVETHRGSATQAGVGASPPSAGDGATDIAGGHGVGGAGSHFAAFHGDDAADGAAPIDFAGRTGAHPARRLSG